MYTFGVNLTAGKCFSCLSLDGRPACHWVNSHYKKVSCPNGLSEKDASKFWLQSSISPPPPIYLSQCTGVILEWTGDLLLLRQMCKTLHYGATISSDTLITTYQSWSSTNGHFIHVRPSVKCKVRELNGALWRKEREFKRWNKRGVMSIRGQKNQTGINGEPAGVTVRHTRANSQCRGTF